MKILVHACWFAVLASCRFMGPSAAYQRLLDRQQTVAKLLQDEQAAFANDVATSRVPQLAAIATRENVQRSFTQATELLAQSKSCMTTEFLDEEEGETGGGACQLLFDRAEAAARAPRLVIATWTRLWQDAPERAAQTTAKIAETTAAIDAALADGGELLALIGAKAEAYPFKRSDLDGRVAALRALPAELTSKQAAVAAQVTANGEGRGDVAELERAFATADAAIVGARSALPDLRARLDQLTNDEHVLLVRLEKTTLGPEEVFVAVTRTIRNGVAQPDAASPIDAATFARYLMMALGVQQTFRDQPVVKRRPLPTVLATCGPKLVVDVELAIAQKEPGQYTDETARSPSPPVLALGHVGNTAYGSWQAAADGGTMWQFDSIWGPRHAQSTPTISDEAYGRYSAWRFDNGFACGFDRAGNRVAGPGTCDDSRAVALVENVLALCAPPPEPDPAGTVMIRGAGPHLRARGMGGGGK